MTASESADRKKSYQELDPVGGYSTRPVSFLLASAVVAYSLVETVVDWPMTILPVAATVALACVWIAAVILAVCSSPMRAPFSRRAFLLVTALGVVGMILDFAASWTDPSISLGEWGPVVAGLLLAGMAPYQPARDIGIVTVLAGLVATIIGVIHPATVGNPHIVTIVEYAVPLAGLGFGAAAYASLLRKQTNRPPSRTALSKRAARMEAWRVQEQTVHEDRVSILNQTVVPFFAELLQRDEVHAADRDRATKIADSIRSVMVADVDRSWLDSVVDQLALSQPDRDLPGSEAIQDDDRLATGMNAEQRIVIRALLVALFDQPGFDPDGFAILFSKAHAAAIVELTAKLDRDDSIPRSGLTPYFAVIRIAFGDLHMSFQAPTLTLRFSYEHK